MIATIKTFIANLRGPAGYNATGAAEDDAAITAFAAETAGPTALGAELAAQRAAHSMVLASAAKIPIPAGMAYSLQVGIQRLTGGRYRCDLTPQSLHKRGTGPTYYVDQVTGSNANTGLSWDQAFADPAYASTANSNAAAEIIVRGGFFTRTQLPTIRRNIIIRADADTRPIFVCCDEVTGWTVHSGTTYKITKSGLIGVIDRVNRDADNDPINLFPAASIAEVIATAGSWYTTAGVVYVHLTDGRAPDANVLINMQAKSLAVHSSVVADFSCYLEGIEFWGGDEANIDARGTDCRFLAKNCKFKFSRRYNGLSILGINLTVLQDCEASKNQTDGFNYHQDSSGRIGKAVEINCVARLNGQVAGSQNGSSAHDGYKVVRVGGLYELNAGGNIADVLAAKSFNVGVTAKNSTGYDYDFYTEGEMWLDGCYADGSGTSLKTDLGGTIYDRGTVYTGAVDGTVIPY